MNRQPRRITNTTDKPIGTQVQFLTTKKSNIPVPIEVDNRKLNIIEWGKRNDYGYYLNYLKEANPIHSGILKSKRHFIISGGLIYEGAEAARYEEFFKNRKQNHRDKNLEGLVSDVAMDYEVANIFIFRVLFTVVGKKMYRKLEAISFEKARIQVAYNDNQQAYATGNICISDNWSDDKVAVEVLSPFDAKNLEQDKCYVMHTEDSGQSLDQTGKKINIGFYPSPPYAGAITAIDTLIQIGIYNNSEIHNGFSLGTMIYLAGGKISDPKDKKDLEQDLTDSTTGALQAGRSMVIYGNGQDQKPTILGLQGNNLADRYINAKKGAEDSIIHAHQVVVPALFGVKADGSFNASELEIGYAIMQANYFTARRDAIISVVNWIMNDIVGITGSVSFGEVQLNLPQEQEKPAFIIEREKLEHKKKDVIFERLKKCGQSRDKFNVLESFAGTDLSDSECFKKLAFEELNDNTQRALELIKDEQGFNAIRKALDISANELANIYAELIAKALITKDGVVTTEGNRQIAINDVTSLKVMYEYRLRPNAPLLVSGGESRPFCTELIDLNRLYTREDIAMISGVEGYDVFAYRGGWYHNRNSGKNEPGCRHEWYQVVTFNN